MPLLHTWWVLDRMFRDGYGRCLCEVVYEEADRVLLNPVVNPHHRESSELRQAVMSDRLAIRSYGAKDVHWELPTKLGAIWVTREDLAQQATWLGSYEDLRWIRPGRWVFTDESDPPYAMIVGLEPHGVVYRVLGSPFRNFLIYDMFMSRYSPLPRLEYDRLLSEEGPLEVEAVGELPFEWEGQL